MAVAWVTIMAPVAATASEHSCPLDWRRRLYMVSKDFSIFLILSTYSICLCCQSCFSVSRRWSCATRTSFSCTRLRLASSREFNFMTLRSRDRRAESVFRARLSNSVGWTDAGVETEVHVGMYSCDPIRGTGVWGDAVPEMSDRDPEDDPKVSVEAGGGCVRDWRDVGRIGVSRGESVACVAVGKNSEIGSKDAWIPLSRGRVDKIPDGSKGWEEAFEQEFKLWSAVMDGGDVYNNCWDGWLRDARSVDVQEEKSKCCCSAIIKRKSQFSKIKRTRA